MALFGPKRIYLDYASATPVDASAARAVMQAMQTLGNPSSIHQEGVEAQKELDAARANIAREFGVKPRELIFTSGGTEANNLAILGFARAISLKRGSLEGTHWVVSAIEHPSVLSCFGEVERLGGSVSFVESDEKGIVRPSAVANVLKRETVLVSVGWANGETGVVQPLSDIARVIAAHEKAHKTIVLFHADAGQAPLYVASTIHSLRIDMLTLDSAKLYGPRGVGALYLGDRAQLSSILFGGSQERGLRPGTENVPLAAGLAEALVQTALIRTAEAKRVKALRDELRDLLEKAAPELVVNGDLAHALPNMLNISIPNIQSEYVTLALDHGGVAISTKSACREGEDRRSHVVEALGDAMGAASSVALAKEERAENTLRFSLGRGTRRSDVRAAAAVLGELMHKLASLGRAKKG